MHSFSLLLILLIFYFIVEFFVNPVCADIVNGIRPRVGRLLKKSLTHMLAALASFLLFQEFLLRAVFFSTILGVAWLLAQLLVLWRKPDVAVALVLKNLIVVSALVIVWSVSIEGLGHVIEHLQEFLTDRRLLILLAYLLITRPASVLVSRVLAPWLADISNSGTSLKNAGTMIGYVERALIVTFILLKHWDAIGFLLTAKGILRFNDLKPEDHRPSTEYVMLGTLLSFMIAICIGAATMHLLTVSSPHKEGRQEEVNRTEHILVWFDHRNMVKQTL